MDVQLTQQPDVFKWGISISRLFLVKSIYIGYMDDPTKYLQKYVWRSKVPLKIRVLCGSCVRRFCSLRIINSKGNGRDVKKLLFWRQCNTYSIIVL
jgi:hypothetical protein